MSNFPPSDHGTKVDYGFLTFRKPLKNEQVMVIFTTANRLIDSEYFSSQNAHQNQPSCNTPQKGRDEAAQALRQVSAGQRIAEAGVAWLAAVCSDPRQTFGALTELHRASAHVGGLGWVLGVLLFAFAIAADTPAVEAPREEGASPRTAWPERSAPERASSRL